MATIIFGGDYQEWKDTFAKHQEATRRQVRAMEAKRVKVATEASPAPPAEARGSMGHIKVGEPELDGHDAITGEPPLASTLQKLTEVKPPEDQ
eukprot:2327574-Karenia_brevis.AAC.1